MGIRLKRVMRYDSSQKKLRLFGLLDASNGWRFTLLGLSISFRRSLAGIYV